MPLEKTSSKKAGRFLLLIIAAFLFTSLFALPALAEKDEVEKPATFTPQISIPGSEFKAGESMDAGKIIEATSSSDLLARYINGFYKYGLSIAGILVTIMLMFAGVVWITSGGDSGKVGRAKKMIAGSLTGIIILACAWLILNTINPKLTSLQTLDVKITGGAYETYLVCCDPRVGENSIKVKVVDGEYYGVEGETKDKKVSCFGTKCDDNQQCLMTTDNQYECFNQYGCCECAKWNIGLGVAFDWTCRDNVTYSNCESTCSKLIDLSGFKYYYYNGSTHTCGPDNRCIPR